MSEASFYIFHKTSFSQGEILILNLKASVSAINYFAGELIIPSEHHEMTVRQKSMFEAEMSMTIKNIRRDDLGSYICVAKNSLGDVESKIRLYGKYLKFD